MIIFQTVGGFSARGALVPGALLGTGEPPATTFRSNAYIHRLNRTLQAEHRANGAYASLKLPRHRSGAVGREGPKLARMGSDHQQATRDLVRLIVANRGIPEDRSALAVPIARGIIGVCNLVPSRLAQQASLRTLRQIEQRLATSYRELIAMAPGADIPLLTALLKRRERLAQVLGG